MTKKDLLELIKDLKDDDLILVEDKYRSEYLKFVFSSSLEANIRPVKLKGEYYRIAYLLDLVTLDPNATKALCIYLN